MNRSRPSLILSATVIFAGFVPQERRWTTPVSTEDSLNGTAPDEAEDADWEILLSHCRALLITEGDHLPSAAHERLAVHLVRVCNNCYRAGLRHSAIIQARKAQAAKKRKSDDRRHIVRQSIVSVCERQKVAPVASQKFATSIRSDVIEAARQFGLADVRAGTSARSIKRHIAALLKGHF